MKIKQYDDGTGEICFSWKEIWTLIKKKKLVFDAEHMKSLAGMFVHIGITMSDKLPEEKQDIRDKIEA